RGRCRDLPHHERPDAHSHGPAEVGSVILEGIVTTLACDGEVNIAPMGPHLPVSFSSSTFPYPDPLQHFILKPSCSPRPYQDRRGHGGGVLPVTDDVLPLAQAAIGTPEPLPPLVPATHIRGLVLRDACRFAEFRVQSCQDRGERATLTVEVL